MTTCLSTLRKIYVFKITDYLVTSSSSSIHIFRYIPLVFESLNATVISLKNLFFFELFSKLTFISLGFLSSASSNDLLHHFDERAFLLGSTAILRTAFCFFTLTVSSIHQIYSAFLRFFLSPANSLMLFTFNFIKQRRILLSWLDDFY